MTGTLRPALLSLALTLVTSVRVAAQAPQTPPEKPAAALPSVDQVLDKYVQSLGGKAAIEKLSSRVSKGTFEASQGVSGEIQFYSKAPNKTTLVVDLSGLGQIRQGFDGAVGWADNPQTGPREMTGQELLVAKRGAEFYQALKLRALYPKMLVQGTQKVGEHEAYLIEADPGDGSLRRMYFDTATGLMVRNEIERDTAQGRGTFETELDDYKEVDGVKLPFTVRQSNPGVSFTIKITEVQHNVPIDDSKFAMPAAP
ncbi:MAG TPA: hypothetical protein VHM88_17530 [Candidatus Acidoferrales bacterium]|jgi:hypothetical protein|nr:hypothetical protein [Candidatus Acidoferrales bacterium]